METIIHPASEFQSLPWHLLTSPQNYSFELGFYDLGEKWHLKYFKPFLKENVLEIWILPEPLQYMLNTVRCCAQADAKKEVAIAFESFLGKMGITYAEAETRIKMETK